MVGSRKSEDKEKSKFNLKNNNASKVLILSTLTLLLLFSTVAVGITTIQQPLQMVHATSLSTSTRPLQSSQPTTPQQEPGSVLQAPSSVEVQGLDTGRGGEPIPDQYIVKLKEPAAGAEAAPGQPLAMQQAVQSLTSEAENLGIDVVNTFGPAAPGFAINVENITGGEAAAANATVPSEQQVIAQIRADPRVEFVVQDITMIPLVQTLPSGVNRVDGDQSPTRSGDGIGAVNTHIAIIDSGIIPNHPDLNVVRHQSFVPFRNAADNCGHGTHVAGIAAARDNSQGVVGTAPGAPLWNLKALERQSNGKCSGAASSIIAAIGFAILNRANIKVINMSLGGFCPTSNLGCRLLDLVYEGALNTAVNNGITVVVSAGNENQNAINFIPARYSRMITVSAMGDTEGKCGGLGGSSDDRRASFSNFGPRIDISAPGVNILSTANNGGTTIKSGTSMSAPHVAGAAALRGQVSPGSTPAQIDGFLKNSGTKLTNAANPLQPCDGQGRGYFIGANADGVAEPLLYMKAGGGPPTGLTGKWRGVNDGGLYYLRQNGNVIWWAGLSQGGAGTTFTNVFRGTIVPGGVPGIIGDNIVGQWCDVPRGTINNCGALTVKVNSLTQLQRVSQTGGFSNIQWTKLP